MYIAICSLPIFIVMRINIFNIDRIGTKLKRRWSYLQASLQLTKLWESERQPISLEKATWTLAGTVVILSIVASAFLPSANTGSHGSEIKDAIKKEIPATAQPGFETQQTTAPIAQPDSAK